MLLTTNFEMTDEGGGDQKWFLELPRTRTEAKNDLCIDEKNQLPTL